MRLTWQCLAQQYLKGWVVFAATEERERERKNRSLFMRRSQSILLHPLQAAEPVRSVKKLLFLCDFVLLAVQNFISRNTGTFPAPAGSYSDNYSKP